VTRRAGLASASYGLGVAAADYDNDGFVDLYFTNLGPNACTGTTATAPSPM